jgi:hypothetical protein
MLLSLERIIIKRNFKEPLMKIYNKEDDTDFMDQGEDYDLPGRKKGVETFSG